MTQQYMWVVQAKWTRHNHHRLWVSWAWTQKSKQRSFYWDEEGAVKNTPTTLLTKWKLAVQGRCLYGGKRLPSFSLNWCSSWKSYISKCTRPICWFHHHRIIYVLSSLIKHDFVFLKRKEKKNRFLNTNISFNMRFLIIIHEFKFLQSINIPYTNVCM